VALLADFEEIAVAEVCADPGGPSPAPHVHSRHVESCYVLEGELVLSAGERELRATAGSWLEVPAGVAHSLSPSGREPVRFLDLHAPSCGFGAFVRSPDAAAFDQQPARQRGRARANTATGTR